MPETASLFFNSHTFLAFYALIYVAYMATSKRLRIQNLVLLAASYVFYAAWDYRFVGLIILSTTVDFLVAKRMEQTRQPARRRAWLTLSLVVNLGLLATFKYLGFAAESFSQLAGLLGIRMSTWTTEIILPVGISFYTFQTLSYTIDVYRSRIRACTDPLGFAVYVAFFPQLIAGPIERASHFLPQVLRPRSVGRAEFAIGGQFILLGYFYKVVLADSIAPMVDQFYMSPDRYGGSIAWLANIGFAIQIYGDFAGYSLIARGISRWMGFRLISNFRQPFLAQSPRDYWSRWHRSLSLWLRRYLYIELGGNRFGLAKTLRNLMITMSLGGLWHGASWNFVFWGIYHGLLLMIQHWWISMRHTVRQADRFSFVPLTARAVATFTLMLIGWTLFRCESLSQVAEVFRIMFTKSLYDPRWLSFAIPIGSALAVALSMELWREIQASELVLLRAPPLLRWSLYAMCFFSVLAVGFRPTSFIYFQF